MALFSMDFQFNYDDVYLSSDDDGADDEVVVAKWNFHYATILMKCRLLMINLRSLVRGEGCLVIEFDIYMYLCELGVKRKIWSVSLHRLLILSTYFTDINQHSLTCGSWLISSQWTQISSSSPIMAIILAPNKWYHPIKKWDPHGKANSCPFLWAHPCTLPNFFGFFPSNFQFSPYNVSIYNNLVFIF